MAISSLAGPIKCTAPYAKGEKRPTLFDNFGVCVRVDDVDDAYSYRSKCQLYSLPYTDFSIAGAVF